MPDLKDASRVGGKEGQAGAAPGQPEEEGAVWCEGVEARALRLPDLVQTAGRVSAG